MATITAVIEEIIFRNQETGYTVCTLSNGHKAVGTLPEINAGTELSLSGEYEKHALYGDQFKIESFSIVYPTSIEGIRKYLGSGLIKGIGKGTADRIISAFGERALEIMDNNIERLLEINGIGEKKLIQIKIGWHEQKVVKDIMLFLQSYNISPNFAVKIYQVYGKESEKIVRENPYRLTHDIWGIGFKTADQIGQTLGFEKEHPTRISSGILHVLQEAAGNGHVYLPIEELIAKCNQLLGVDLSAEYSVLREMEEKNRIKIAGDKVYLSLYYTAEKSAEKKILFLNNYLNEFSKDEIDNIIINPEFYSPEQIDAITHSLLHKLLIITGGPGTGKTTALKGIISAYLQLDKEILLAAPTGRAAKRMSEVIGLKAGTIHRLLEYNPNEMIFLRNENYPLECDLLIIDEVSMIDILLFYSLLRAVTPETTVVLVGDVDQLPSVGAGNVLKDLISADIIPSVKLTKIFRQAEESKIIVNAHKINQGIIPAVKNEENSDFFFITENDDKKIAETIINLAKERLPVKYGFDPMQDIQVLTPMYKGEIGANNLNSRLQEALNFKEHHFTRGEKIYKTGDKVMQLRNNYTKEVFNGDIGFISGYDLRDHLMDIDFGGRIIHYESADLDEITLAYAITVHKSQGSEYPCVIMPLSTSHYIMLQRNLLYTAVTRASKLLVLVGSQKALAIAVNNKQSQKRYTSFFENTTEKITREY